MYDCPFTPRQFTCSICGKKFKRPSDKRRHLEKVHGADRKEAEEIGLPVITGILTEDELGVQTDQVFYILPSEWIVLYCYTVFTLTSFVFSPSKQWNFVLSNQRIAEKKEAKGRRKCANDVSPLQCNVKVTMHCQENETGCFVFILNVLNCLLVSLFLWILRF